MGNPVFQLAPSARCFRGLIFLMPAGGRGATFYRCWAVPPPCGEAVCGAGVWPAVRDGGIDFKTCLSTLPAETLPKYYALLGFGMIAVTSHNLPVKQEAGPVASYCLVQ